MEYRRLGKSGLKVSEFSFGSWVTFGKQVNGSDAVDLMKLAYDNGVNFFDNAEGYESGKSEIVMGEALSRLGWSRDSFVVSSKVFWGGQKPTQRGLSRKHVTDACHAALKRLQVDYLDLFFCHRPDIDTPIEETVRAMHDLVAQGKVLYWGTSEWSAQQLTEAYAVARDLRITPPTMEQPQYNIFERQKVESDYLPLYDLMGLGTTIWSPLASGVLTGKYNNGVPADSRMNLPGYEWLKEKWSSDAGRAQLRQVGELAKLADEIGMSITHLALLWCLANRNVSTVILGASRASQLQDNLAALSHRQKMTSDVLERIDTIVGNKPEGPRRF
ncbi:potassium channel beta subunit family protein [Rhizobium ruizarguesonis]|jgi:voltage-dependent potassium channel beta subunit|uniref:Aldo/keto reductase n=1 Tax=Rhizobium ruizarguesonis TaxID=2081791 RepID=A0AAE5C247_9HYPH|nr:aldo/keto reductase [Rhizobium ruizarguesonis]MBY5803185.1 aldo/keto reductase [Rhizobium leguminosarum]NKL14522.1 aldo/keto reductase [Rhizobium leguminosarum bv. viciae]QIO48052.1 aldo/keto reductase [Rhizobium leguminosarum bv. trifolii]MBY5844240.1 aldo/keto reductase [Rhizobium leguminosarum]MBY5850717.1 aldo/keto reductase [Rhizobium leguminosarum]